MLEFTFEPSHEKTNNLRFRPGPAQTSLSVQLQKMATSLKFWVKGEEILYYLSSETKALISFAVRKQRR